MGHRNAEAVRSIIRSAPDDNRVLLDQLKRRYLKAGRPLEIEFRELVEWVRLGDQLTHQIHPYPAKLLPHIAHFFARANLTAAGPVLDPFCGSGTVALESSLAGFQPLVADANPLARLITKVKTTPYDPNSLRSELNRIVARTKRMRAAPEVPIVNADLWYSAKSKRRLEIARRAIDEVESSGVRDFFLVCLSVAARKASFADPRVSVPVRLRTRDKFDETKNQDITARLKWLTNTDPLIEFERISHANITRVEITNALHPGRRAAKEVGNDARRLLEDGLVPLTSGSVPLVITSPPYGSAQKYIRSSGLSLNWIGLAGPNALAGLESQSIGREHLARSRELPAVEVSLPSSFEEFLSLVEQRNPRRAAITRTYLHEIQAAFLEAVRVLKPGGAMVIVTGNNQVSGYCLRNDKFIEETLKSAGLSLELALVDSIKSRGLMTKRNKTASVISLEQVHLYRKPL